MWVNKIIIKHFLTEKEDHKSVQKSMSLIAEALEKSSSFNRFDASKFHNIPKGDDFFAPIDYANKLLTEMYDYADFHRIWIA